MADFTSPFWSIFITVATIASIVALIILFAVFKGGKASSTDEEAETTGHVWDGDLREYNNPMPRWWLNLFYITLIFSIVYLALYPGLGAFGGILGWSQIRQYEEEIQAAERSYGPLFNRYLNQDLETLAGNPEALEVGRRLFSNYCSTCHGSDARGARGFPNLRDNDWLYGGDPETIKTTILKGRSGLMPGWKDIITDQEIEDITHHVLSMSDRLFDPAAASRGKPVYDSYCAVCHGEDGTGKFDFGAPNLADDIWLHGASKHRIIEGIGAGFENVMPPHEEFLGEAKSHLLAAYVYSLSRN